MKEKLDTESENFRKETALRFTLRADESRIVFFALKEKEERQFGNAIKRVVSAAWTFRAVGKNTARYAGKSDR